jgi:hypothetical protein
VCGVGVGGRFGAGGDGGRWHTGGRVVDAKLRLWAEFADAHFPVGSSNGSALIALAVVHGTSLVGIRWSRAREASQRLCDELTCAGLSGRVGGRSALVGFAVENGTICKRQPLFRRLLRLWPIPDGCQGFCPNVVCFHSPIFSISNDNTHQIQRVSTPRNVRVSPVFRDKPLHIHQGLPLGEVGARLVNFETRANR